MNEPARPRLRDLMHLTGLSGRLPPWVQQLRKVDQREPLPTDTSSGKVEDNGGFHRREQRVARAQGRVVHEVGLVDPAVFRLGSGFADDTIKIRIRISTGECR